jgi:hypothetical protein
VFVRLKFAFFAITVTEAVTV